MAMFLRVKRVEAGNLGGTYLELDWARGLGKTGVKKVDEHGVERTLLTTVELQLGAENERRLKAYLDLDAELFKEMMEQVAQAIFQLNTQTAS